MKIKRTGLILGKFAPLHIGHQYLIESALKEVDELVVLIYDSPNVTNIPLSVRANWIESLYRAKVIKGWAGPQECGYSDKIKRIQENYIKRKIGNIKITDFFSSEDYGEHISKSLEATNHLIDKRRINYNISATQIRENPFKYKDYLHPLVYKSLITNVVFLGAPSTGKTTIASNAAKEFNTQWMPEYGREYWEKHQINRRLTKLDMIKIVYGHLKKENELILKSNKYLFTDTNALITEMFSYYYHGEACYAVRKYSLQCYERYDVVFLCDVDIPYENTWDRSGDVNRKEFQRMIIDALHMRKIPYIVLNGSIEERMKKIKESLKNINKV